MVVIKHKHVEIYGLPDVGSKILEISIDSLDPKDCYYRTDGGKCRRTGRLNRSEMLSCSLEKSYCRPSLDVRTHPEYKKLLEGQEPDSEE